MELWEIVEEGFEEVSTEHSTEEEQKEFKENRKKNAQALRHIQQGISKSIFSGIFGVAKAKHAWKILKLEFQETEKIVILKLQALWKSFENLQMGESEIVKDFFSRTSEIVT